MSKQDFEKSKRKHRSKDERKTRLIQDNQYSMCKRMIVAKEMDFKVTNFTEDE